MTVREALAMEGLDLDRRGGLALWRQIETTLAREIERGVHAAGARLPTEHVLADRFQVNRHTVRRALAELEARGLVRVEQGRGTFVEERPIDWTIDRRTRFSQNAMRLGLRHDPSRLVRALEMPASETVAEALELAPGTPVVLIERIGLVEGRPLALGAHHFPAARFPGLIDAFRLHGSITGALAACGVEDYVRKSTRITARLPTADEARHLEQPTTRPILQTEAINIDLQREPIEYGVARFAADRIQLVVEGSQE